MGYSVKKDDYCKKRYGWDTWFVKNDRSTLPIGYVTLWREGYSASSNISLNIGADKTYKHFRQERIATKDEAVKMVQDWYESEYLTKPWNYAREVTI